MPDERRQKLESLGFDWDMLASAWQDGFAALKRFQAREGHCRVPQEHLEENYRLGSWVANQRKKKTAMPTDRRQRLDGLGFDLNSLISGWEEGFAALQLFQRREGHFEIPQKHIEAGYKLGHWVSHQRADKDTMQAERRQRLDALGFVWDSKDAAWDKGFTALKQFKEREGNCRVSGQHIEGTYKLGQWVGMQRSRRDIMPVERRQKLEALGFEWEPFTWTSLWEEGFAALKQFKEREGHCRVPQQHTEGTYRLGQWVANQRKKKTTMPTDRRQRLDALGFNWSQKKKVK